MPLDTGVCATYVICMTNKSVLTARITAPQLAFLRQEAERLGIAVGELVRRIIDQYREGRES